MPRIAVVVILASILFSHAVQADDRPGAISVEPFTQIGDQPNRNWIGSAVRESLASESSRWNLRLDRSVRIVGSFQTIESQLRIDARIIAGDRDQLGTVTSKGRVDDLFMMEDDLAEQARTIVRRLIGTGVSTASAEAKRKLPGPDAATFERKFSGPVKVQSPYPAAKDWLDPNARAAKWRYYYSQPIGYYGYGCYGGWGGGLLCGCAYGYSGGRAFGRPAFVFAAYNGGY